MNKDLLGVYVTPDTAALLRERAARAGAGISDLADLCLRYALDRLPEEGLRAWAASRVTTRPRRQGAITRNEQRCYQALTRLLAAAEGGVYRFALQEVANSAGLYLRDAYRALKALQARGTVTVAESPDRDRWDRPVESFWSLASI